MPIPNPRYNPDWQQIHDHHAAETQRLSTLASKAMARMNALYEDDQKPGSPAYDYAAEQYQELHEASGKELALWQDSYHMRYPTIQGYAEWVFTQFPPGFSGSTLTALPDFEQFKTLEEVNQAWSRFNESVREAESLPYTSMEIGQPNGLDIFQENGNNRVFSYWREFKPEEFFDEGMALAMDAHLNTLITVDARANGETHICFMHDHQSHGLSASGNEEHLASVIFKEAQQNYERQKPKQIKGETIASRITSLARKFVAAMPGFGLSPQMFHFYIHVPPAGYHREYFHQVNLRYKPHRDYPKELFENTNDDTVYDKIPERVQKAQLDLIRPQKPAIIAGLLEEKLDAEHK